MRIKRDAIAFRKSGQALTPTWTENLEGVVVKSGHVVISSTEKLSEGCFHESGPVGHLHTHRISGRFVFSHSQKIWRIGFLDFHGCSRGDDVKILPGRRIYVETCTDRLSFNVLSGKRKSGRVVFF
jgi:hypothetical protein